jgi:hypothetical protein
MVEWLKVEAMSSNPSTAKKKKKRKKEKSRTHRERERDPGQPGLHNTPCLKQNKTTTTNYSWPTDVIQW